MKNKVSFMKCFLGVLAVVGIVQLLSSITPVLGNSTKVTRATYSEFVYEVSADEITIVGYTGEEAVLTIPNQIDGVDVISIGDGAFKGYDNLTKVIIPETVLYIGNEAFNECYNLKEIELSDSVEKIGTYAFARTALEDVKLPVALMNLGTGAFSHCCSMKTIELSASMSVIEDNTFESCVSLEKIDILGSVLSVGSMAFADCTALKSVTMLPSVVTIGQFAFQNCESMESMELPGSVKELGAYAFSGCKSLASVKLSDALVKIEEGTFESCTSLTEVVINDNVKEISQEAFSSCEALTEITIPNSVTKLSDRVFIKNKSLSTVRLGAGIKEIGENVFFNCNSLEKVFFYGNAPAIGEGAFSMIYDSAVITVPSDTLEKYQEKLVKDNILVENAIIVEGDYSVEYVEDNDSSEVVAKPDSSLTGGSKNEDIIQTSEPVATTKPECELEHTSEPGDNTDATSEPVETGEPTIEPDEKPEVTTEPTTEPVEKPEVTVKPTTEPVEKPEVTVKPTVEPTKKPEVTVKPTVEPTKKPEVTVKPTVKPTKKPVVTVKPTPTVKPTKAPVVTAKPTVKPTVVPTPTVKPSEDNKNTDKSKCTVRFLNSDGSVIKKLSQKTKSKITLLDQQKKSGYIFMGWGTTVNGKNSLYQAKGSYTVSGNVDFKAVYVKLYMLNGASIRFSNPTGIRFSSRVDIEGYNSLKKYAKDFSYGTIICPTSYLSGLKDFTVNDLKKAGKNYLDIDVSVWYNVTSSYREFTGVMTNVKVSNYERNFSARPYVEVTYADGTTKRLYASYSETNNSRSVCQIAKAALKDSSAYTKNQKKILQLFIDATN